MMNAHAAAARSLREVSGLQGNYDRTSQNFRILNQLYSAEKDKVEAEKERALRLENELQKLRAENESLVSRLDVAESFRQGAERNLKAAEKSFKRRKKAMRAVGCQFKKTLREVKDKLRGLKQFGTSTARDPAGVA